MHFNDSFVLDFYRYKICENGGENSGRSIQPSSQQQRQQLSQRRDLVQGDYQQVIDLKIL